MVLQILTSFRTTASHAWIKLMAALRRTSRRLFTSRTTSQGLYIPNLSLTGATSGPSNSGQDHSRPRKHCILSGIPGTNGAEQLISTGDFGVQTVRSKRRLAAASTLPASDLPYRGHPSRRHSVIYRQLRRRGMYWDLKGDGMDIVGQKATVGGLLIGWFGDVRWVVGLGYSRTRAVRKYSTM